MLKQVIHLLCWILGYCSPVDVLYQIRHCLLSMTHITLSILLNKKNILTHYNYTIVFTWISNNFLYSLCIFYFSKYLTPFKILNLIANSDVSTSYNINKYSVCTNTINRKKTPKQQQNITLWGCSDQMKPNILKTVEIPTTKPYIFFFFLISLCCIKWCKYMTPRSCL